MNIITIHTARNEHSELVPTCESMKNAGATQIISFDDASSPQLVVPEESTTHIRHNSGNGPSVNRNMGVNITEYSEKNVFVFADAHTRIDSLHDICKISLENNIIVLPAMKVLHGNPNITGYSRDFILHGENKELIGFNKNNQRPTSRFSFTYGSWGGFFIFPQKVFDTMGGWVNHKYWGYNDPSLILKAYFCNIDTVLDKDTFYYHKNKVKTGFGYRVLPSETIFNIIHTYYVIFDSFTFENHWLPLLEKSYPKIFQKALDYISSDSIKKEEKIFKTLKQKNDSEFFDKFLLQENNRQPYDKLYSHS